VVWVLVGGDSMLSTATISWDGRGNSTTVESTILRENFRPGSGVIKNGYSSLTGTGKGCPSSVRDSAEPSGKHCHKMR
jgi:hypothetical protein